MEKQKKIAEWWCDFNRFEVPGEFARHPIFRDSSTRELAIRVAFDVIDEIAGKEGLAEWQRQHRKGEPK